MQLMVILNALARETKNWGKKVALYFNVRGPKYKIAKST